MVGIFAGIIRKSTSITIFRSLNVIWMLAVPIAFWLPLRRWLFGLYLPLVIVSTPIHHSALLVYTICPFFHCGLIFLLSSPEYRFPRHLCTSSLLAYYGDASIVKWTAIYLALGGALNSLLATLLTVGWKVLFIVPLSDSWICRMSTASDSRSLQ